MVTKRFTNPDGDAIVIEGGRIGRAIRVLIGCAVIFLIVFALITAALLNGYVG